MSKIRVGMIRCDLHAYWYAALFAEHDAELLGKVHPCLQWLFYGGYWDEPTSKRVPTVPGFELARLWDHDRATAEQMATVFCKKPVVCDNVDQVCHDVDLVFIADCFTEGEDHRQLAEVAMSNRIPLFVDKPMTHTLADAKDMINFAQRHRTPLMSASLLLQSPEAARFRRRFTEIAPVNMGIVRGAVGKAGNLAGIFHTLSLAQALFGQGVGCVEAMGNRPFEYLRLHYPNGEQEPFEVLVINNYVVARHIYCGFRADVYGQSGVIHSPFVDDFVFPNAGACILDSLKKMVATKEPPLSYDSMLELIRIVEAGRIAQKSRRTVELSELD